MNDEIIAEVRTIKQASKHISGVSGRLSGASRRRDRLRLE